MTIGNVERRRHSDLDDGERRQRASPCAVRVSRLQDAQGQVRPAAADVHAVRQGRRGVRVSDDEAAADACRCREAEGPGAGEPAG